MDSTSIAATAQKVLLERGKPFNFQAFTMRDRLMMPEEDSYASIIAHYIGIPLNEMNCESYFCNVPKENPSTPLPEPISIPARNPGNDFTKRCADHARVVLTGQTHLISRNIILQGFNSGLSYIFRSIFARPVKFSPS